MYVKLIVLVGVLITLILISVLGVIAIPFGNPKFIPEAIIIELSFITLSILIWRGYTKMTWWNSLLLKCEKKD